MREFSPDVLVMEVRLGGRDALKKLEELNGEFSDVNIVAFSGQENPTHIARAAAVGCYDYVSKTSSCQQLIRSLKSARHGRTSTPRQLDGRDSGSNAPPQTVDGSRCSLDQPRDAGVAAYCDGFEQPGDRQIAGDQCGKRFKEHVQNILRKLDVKRPYTSCRMGSQAAFGLTQPSP